jgi:hypothetical protein
MRSSGGSSEPRHAIPRLNATNLAGITTLMNSQHVKPGINLGDIEKSIMGKNNSASVAAKKPENDPVRIYAAELSQLANELGIDLHDDTDSVASAPAKTSMRATGGHSGAGHNSHTTIMSRSTAVTNKYVDNIDLNSSKRNHTGGGRSVSSGSASGSSQSGSASGSEGSECSCDDDCPEECDCECHEECDCDDDCPDDCDCDCHFESESGSGSGSGSSGSVDEIISQFQDDMGFSDNKKHGERRHRISGSIDIPHGERHRHRDSDDRRKHIDSIIGNIRQETRTAYGGERERIQDIKASKLEQIGQLNMTLEEEGIDCSAINKPTSESSMEEIDSVLNILRLKNDRNRYSSIAEEVILGLAEGIETVFDGSRTVPLVGWRPDYTGYHNTVSVKLHRMRPDTSQIVGNIIEKYSIGPTARILMELFPSFLLYSRHQKKQRNLPGLSSDPRVGDVGMAMSSIRASDELRNL